ncbi:MAG: helix-turn-helix domain-containing protein [Deltaproteobacteria bacterium]|nr:helix-turn-helix domain-containing protein [Deltaproteobacteria bacterium]
MSNPQLATIAPRLMPSYDPREHCEVVAGMINRSGLTIERVARLIGKHPTTLARELNPDDDGAKLSFTDEVKIAAVCGLFDSRDYAEFHLGRCAFLLPQADGRFADVFETVGRATKEFGEFMTKLAESARPDSEGGASISPAEAAAALEELKDVEQQLAMARAFLTGIRSQGGGGDYQP